MGKGKDGSSEYFSGWYPSDVRFRKDFNSAIAGAIRHIAGHGDTRALGVLIEGVPDDDLRRRMCRRLVQSLPVDFDRQKGTFTLRKGRGPFDWLAVDHVNVFDPQITASTNAVKVGNVELSVDEFVFHDTGCIGTTIKKEIAINLLNTKTLQCLHKFG